MLRLFLKQALHMGGIGIVAGSLLSLGSRTAAEQWGAAIPAFDPVLFAAVVAALMLTTSMAALISARRAAEIDPKQAIRED